MTFERPVTPAFARPRFACSLVAYQWVSQQLFLDSLRLAINPTRTADIDDFSRLSIFYSKETERLP